MRVCGWSSSIEASSLPRHPARSKPFRWSDRRARPQACNLGRSARVAQLVEHFTCNEDVAGSIPASGSRVSHGPFGSRPRVGIVRERVGTRQDLARQPGANEEACMLSDFKKFVLRGNVVDLAVAVVVGVAFTAMITAFVADFITPLIAAIFGKPRLLRPDLHRQPLEVQVRVVPQRAAVVPHRGDGRVLRRRGAAHRAHAPAQRLPREEPRARDAGVPGVPERHSGRGTAVRLLHVRGGGRRLNGWPLSDMARRLRWRELVLTCPAPAVPAGGPPRSRRPRRPRRR